MTTDQLQEPQAPKTRVKPYKQIILFGDSITQMSGNQDLGFGFSPAFQAGMSSWKPLLLSLPYWTDRINEPGFSCPCED